MSQFRVTYNRATRLWTLRETESGGEVAAQGISVDVPIKTNGNGFMASGVLNTDQVLSAGKKDAVVGTARLERAVPIPGRINNPCMLDWVVVFNEVFATWNVFRPDKPSVLVTTKNLEINCHADSRDGELLCRAEMLKDGATNRERAGDADRVVLRTLSVYNQVLEMPVISTGGRSKLR